MSDSRRAWLLLATGLATTASFVGLAIWNRFPVAYRDDWDWLDWVLSGPISLDRLLQPHNEHLIPLPRLLLWLQYRLEGIDGQMLFWLALGCQLAIVALFLREIVARWPDGTGAFRRPAGAEPARDIRRAAIGLSLMLLCFSWQLQSIVFVAAILFPMVQLFAATGVIAAVQAVDAVGTPRRWWLVAAHVSSFGAMLTTTNGMAVPVALAILAVGMRERLWVAGSHLVVAAAGGAVFAAKVLLSGMPTVSAATTNVPLGSVLAYFGAFFAPFVAYFSPMTAAIVGAAFPLVGGWLVARLIVRRKPAPRLEWFNAGLMLFVIGTALLAAVGRASFGVDQAAQSRYATYTLVYWAALLLSILSVVTRSADTAWSARLASFGRRAAVPIVVVFLIAHVVSGLVWTVKADHVAAAGLTIRADVPDEAWVTVLHPHPQVIQRVQHLLRDRSDGRHIDPWIDSQLELRDDVPTCDASLALTTVTNPGEPTLRMSGDMRTDAERGVIVNESGIVVGLARRAPLVETADAPRAVVIDATREAILARDARAVRWFGLARQSGATYRLVAMTDAGSPLCVVSLGGG